MTWFTRRLLIWDLHCVVHAQMFSKPSVRSITVSRCVYVEFYHVLDMHLYFSSKNLVFVILCSQNNFKTEARHIGTSVRNAVMRGYVIPSKIPCS